MRAGKHLCCADANEDEEDLEGLSNTPTRFRSKQNTLVLGFVSIFTIGTSEI
jgi:hypothetical protein